MALYALLDGTASTTMTVSQIISMLGEAAQGVLGFVADVGSTIAENPMLFLFIGIGFTGTIIGVFKKLMHI